MDKILLLVRHAHRDKELGRDQDNGLSAKGRGQAQLLFKYLLQNFDMSGALVVSSPKRRCIETLLPIVRDDESRVHKLAYLDEGFPLESKIEEFIAWWENVPEVLTIACSHGDWIPAFVEEVANQYLDLRKGGLIKFVGEQKRIKLAEVIQKF